MGRVNACWMSISRRAVLDSDIEAPILEIFLTIQVQLKSSIG